MFKLVKVEFKKIFHQSLVYVMAIILCASLIASLFLFSPAKRNTSASTFSLVSSNVTEAKQNFQTKKTQSDENIDNLKTSIENYRADNTSLLLKNYKNSDGRTLSQLFAIYNNVCTTSNDVDLLNQHLDKLNKALEDVQSIYKDATQISSTYIPNVLLQTKTNSEITSNLTNAITETKPAADLDINAHKKINETLKAKNYSEKFKALFDSISDIGLSDEKINEITTKYFDTQYDEKQNVLIQKINNAKTQEEVYELAKQYNANAYELTQIAYLTIYDNLATGLKDGEIQGLYNSTLLSQKTGFYSSSVTKYAISEKLTYYTYLWDKNLQDYNFSSATNGTIMSNSEESAIDFAIYAFQIASFVILVYCVIVSAMSISNEMTFGTLKMLATKPISRSSIISAKIISTFLVGLIFTLFAAVASFVMGIISFGFNGTTIITVFNSANAIALHPIVYMLLLLASQLIKIFIFITISIFFSTLFKNSIPALIISLVIFFSGSILNVLIPTANFLAYVPFFNIDFFVYFGGCALTSTTSPLSLLFTSTLLNNTNIYLTLAFAIALPTLFWLLSILILKKRDII